jgi:hypothetical protein
MHEGLLELIRKRPAFAAELLRELLDVSVPEFTEAEIIDASLNELVPTEYHPDLIVLLFKAEGKAVLGMVFEAQLKPKAYKRRTWPMYAVSLRARRRCPVVVVVLTVNEATARWAARPIPLGGQSVFVPLVIGPKGVPIITEPERAARVPELGVLSTMAHGRGDVAVALAIAQAAAHGISGLDRDQWVLYSGLIEASLSDAARKAFEMLPEGQQFFSESQRRSFERGEAQGKAEGKAESILTFLEARGLPITEQQRERILTCSEPDLLDRWSRQAATITSTDELFTN